MFMAKNKVRSVPTLCILELLVYPFDKLFCQKVFIELVLYANRVVADFIEVYAAAVSAIVVFVPMPEINIYKCL